MYITFHYKMHFKVSSWTILAYKLIWHMNIDGAVYLSEV